MIAKQIDVNDKQKFQTAEPFPHIVYDDFLEEEIALQLYEDIPTMDSEVWFQYENQIENKRLCNHWDRFPKTTYNFFTMITSPQFTQKLSEMTGIFPLVADIGLHGGGWHAHGPGGLLNIHKDYSIHPKLKLERALNLILYVTPNWDPEWGGSLGLWTEKDGQPDELKVNVDCIFNRAVVFDTRKNSWHGLPKSITCPPEAKRTSLAVYYLTTPDVNAEQRERALFAPSDWQKGDKEIEEFIKQRSGMSM